MEVAGPPMHSQIESLKRHSMQVGGSSLVAGLSQSATAKVVQSPMTVVS